MQYLKKILGDRIYLSPRGASDEEVENYTKWKNDFKVTDYTGRSAYMRTEQEEREWLEKSAIEGKDRNFSIIELKNNKLIGTIRLEKINWIARNASLGIYIGDENYRNKGYGQEAVKLILEFGFKYLNLHSIQLELIEVNKRAHECYLKCGFKDTGRKREELWVNGKYYDNLYMDILENEFEGNYIRNKEIE